MKTVRTVHVTADFTASAALSWWDNAGPWWPSRSTPGSASPRLVARSHVVPPPYPLRHSLRLAADTSRPRRPSSSSALTETFTSRATTSTPRCSVPGPTGSPDAGCGGQHPPKAGATCANSGSWRAEPGSCSTGHRHSPSRPTDGPVTRADIAQVADIQAVRLQQRLYSGDIRELDVAASGQPRPLLLRATQNSLRFRDTEHYKDFNQHFDFTPPTNAVPPPPGK